MSWVHGKELLDLKLKHVPLVVVVVWLFALGLTRRVEQPSQGTSNDIVRRLQNPKRSQNPHLEKAIKSKLNFKKVRVAKEDRLKKGRGGQSVNEEVAEIVSIHKDSGNPHLLVAFTNNAEANSMKSFLCNLKELGRGHLLSQLVVITSDKEAEESVSKFTSPDRVFHRTFQGSKQAQEDLPQPIQAAQDLAQFRIHFLRELLRANVSLVMFDTTHIREDEERLSWLENQDGNDVIVESPQHDILENEDQLEEKAFSGPIFLNSTENARRLWDRVEKETQFLWSQNDTTHYGERLALNFILTLKEQKAEEGMREMAERYYPFLHSLSWAYFPTYNATRGNSLSTDDINKRSLCHFD